MLPGVVGQYYMSQGVIGVLLGGVFFGVLCKFIDNRLNVVLNSRSVGFSECWLFLIACGVFLSYRSLSPGLFVPVVFLFIMLGLGRLRVSYY